MLNFKELTREDKDIIAKLEALLFVSPGPASINQLAEALGLKKEMLEHYIGLLSDHYRDFHGIRIQKSNDHYQLTTASDFAELIETFLGLEVTTRLTQASLEALAIIAYKQPATRPDIEAIRGVNCDGVIKSLLAKGLIEELGRSDAVGRPILYGVTNEFLQYFGLESLDDLPNVDFDALTGNMEPPEEERRILKD